MVVRVAARTPRGKEALDVRRRYKPSAKFTGGIRTWTTCDLAARR